MPEILFDKATLAYEISWDQDWVTAVAFVGSSQKLAAANQRGQILLWELPEKPEMPGGSVAPARRLDGHTNAISALAATPDGRWLISASLDGGVRLWDMQANATASEEFQLSPKAQEKKKEADRPPGVKVAVQSAAKVLEGHSDWVRSLCLGNDGTRLLTGDDQGVAIFWDLTKQAEIRRHQLPGWHNGVAFSPDGQRAVRCSYAPRYRIEPNAAQIFNLESGEIVFDLTKECPKAADCAWSADGQQLALGQGQIGETTKCKVFLVDPSSGKKTHELPGHEGSINGLAYHPGGDYLATCGRDTLVRIWNCRDGKEVAQLGKLRGGQFKDWIHGIAFSPDGLWLAAADMGGFVHVWSLPNGE